MYWGSKEGTGWDARPPMTQMSKVKLWGVPLSQPFRSVAWACLQKRLPFEVKLCVPGSSGKGGSRSDPFLALNPSGTVPLLQDGELTLAQSPAIMCYLANRHGWKSLYPADHAKRAGVDSYLHWHHSNTRRLAFLFAQIGALVSVPHLPHAGLSSEQFSPSFSCGSPPGPCPRQRRGRGGANRWAESPLNPRLLLATLVDFPRGRSRGVAGAGWGWGRNLVRCWRCRGCYRLLSFADVHALTPSN